MKKKIHYHSECEFFAGCENMIGNFLMSKNLSRDFHVSFSYAQSKKYEEGLWNRVPRTTAKYFALPLPKLPELVWFRCLFHGIFHSSLKFVVRLLIAPLILIYEIIVLYILFKKIKPDLVHINNGGYPGALSARAAALASKLASVPIILMVVNNVAVGYERYSRKFELPIDLMVAHCVDLFITSSSFTAARLAKVLRLKPSKVMTLYNGVNISNRGQFSKTLFDKSLKLKKRGINFGVVAILERRKGHEILLKAIKKLFEQGFGHDDFHVFVEGEGSLKDELKQFVIKENLAPFVTFLGHEKNIEHFMNACDSIILPSIADEDFPNVVIEAMSLSKLVIASKVSGTIEQVHHNETGFLVSPGDVNELAAAMKVAIRQPNIAKKLGSKAKKRYDDFFTAELAIGRYLGLYRTLIFGERGKKC